MIGRIFGSGSKTPKQPKPPECPDSPNGKHLFGAYHTKGYKQCKHCKGVYHGNP